jgi:glycerol-3-phosphate dehydrogenase
LLLEQNDFAKGTSSRSTKLIHGGLRYLKQGKISLVIESLKERGILCQNAPHLVAPLGFFIPSYRWWERPFYTLGLKIYDFLAGKRNFAKSHFLTLEQTRLRFPTIELKNLRGGLIYYDGQFDDARLAISLAQTTFDEGGYLLNYMRVEKLLKNKGRITGVEARDLETDETYELHAKAIINATGVFTDTIRKLDDPTATEIISPSQGIHLVLDRSFLPSDLAILIPQTEDGRILFFLPWHRHLLIGTTDTPIQKVTLEPHSLQSEVDYLLKYSSQYLIRKPTQGDILSIFAGLRPLVKQRGKGSTAALSRDHVIEISPSKLITICGGKWTTYRRMAEDVINQAMRLGDLPNSPCRTSSLPLHGYRKGKKHHIDSWVVYGSDTDKLNELIKRHPSWGHLLHPRLPYLPVEIIWAVRQEMARTLEDVLSRRTRALFLDAHAALEIAPRVAALMAEELGKPASWEQQQVQEFSRLAKNYL